MTATVLMQDDALQASEEAPHLDMQAEPNTEDNHGNRTPAYSDSRPTEQALALLIPTEKSPKHIRSGRQAPTGPLPGSQSLPSSRASSRAPSRASRAQSGAHSRAPSRSHASRASSRASMHLPPPGIASLPNEILLHILGYLDVPDVLAVSRVSQHLRRLCVAPVLHIHRLRYSRAVLPAKLTAPQRPSLTELIRKHIFLTRTTAVSRTLARSLMCIRLSRRLETRPKPEEIIQRGLLPRECAPGTGTVSPWLAARKIGLEREKLKDRLRTWVGGVWVREVGVRSERARRRDESVGVGRVWRLRKFWERLSRTDVRV